MKNETIETIGRIPSLEVQMSQYMQRLCDALTDVLDHATALKRERLGGYAANLGFWVSEVEHRLSLLRGYLHRREAMVEGMMHAYETMREPRYRFDPPSMRLLDAKAPDVGTDWETSRQMCEELHQRVLRSLHRFVRKLRSSELISDQQVFDLEDRLHVALRGSKPVPYGIESSE